MKYNFQYLATIAKLTLPKLNALSIRGSYYYLDLVIELSCSLSSRSFIIGRQFIARLPLGADWLSLARPSTSKPLLPVLQTPLIYFSPLCFPRICRAAVGQYARVFSVQSRYKCEKFQSFVPCAG